MAGRERGDISLLPKHEKFLELWLREGNATQAYQEVYPGTTYGSASVLASRLMKKLKPQIIQIADKRGLTPVYIFAVLQIAIEDEEAKWSDRLRALEDLMDILGIRKGDKEESKKDLEDRNYVPQYTGWEAPKHLIG